MKKYFITFVLLLIANVCLAQTNLDTLYKEAIALMHEAKGDHAKTEQAIDLLSIGLKESPENVEFLRMRSNLYTVVGKLREARDDVDVLVRLKPTVSSYLMLKCTLDESLGEPRESYMKCYDQAIMLGGKELEDKKDTDLGYICALLMAEKPEAKELAEKYILSLKDSPMEILYKEMLINFDRKNFLFSTNP